MSVYTIVSTYPENGSKNIGDQLITQSLIETIKMLKGADCTINVIWRADSWDNVESKVLSSSAIIFACLAIRPKMATVEYPYLEELIKVNIPLFVVSAGTALPVEYNNRNVFDYVNEESRVLLNELDKKAVSFTTRGYLTQTFCQKNGMHKCKFAGDIAFLNKNFNEIGSFQRERLNIATIVVSDPHYAVDYIGSFDTLIFELKKSFPQAEIVIALHGNEPIILKYAIDNNIKVEKIYEDKNQGLSVYDKADLHVGFRVHAHVSTLKRRKYSYLLEQDGRGCDYGMTLERKISIANYRVKSNSIYFKVKSKIFSYFNLSAAMASCTPPKQIVSMILHDSQTNFSKFNGLEMQLENFSKDLIFELNKLP